MPRLTPIDPATATGEAKELLDGIQAEFGMTPNSFRAMANNPAVLRGWIELSGALETTLARKLGEQIAIAIAEQNGCAYCLSAHTAVAGRLGVDANEIDHNRSGESDDERAAAALRFALTVNAKRGGVSDNDLAEIRAAGYDDADPFMCREGVIAPAPGRPAPSVLFVFEHLAGVGGRDGVPALPGDVKDDGGYDEADDRVGQVKPERDDGGAGEHAEADEAVDAGVLSVRDQGRALQLAAGTQAHLGGDLVADEADDPCGGKQPQVREAARMHEALDRLAERDRALIRIASTTARPA